MINLLLMKIKEDLVLNCFSAEASFNWMACNFNNLRIPIAKNPNLHFHNDIEMITWFKTCFYEGFMS